MPGALRWAAGTIQIPSNGRLKPPTSKLKDECSDAKNNGAGKDAKDAKGDYFLAVHAWIIAESGSFSCHFTPYKSRPIRRASVFPQISRVVQTVLGVSELAPAMSGLFLTKENGPSFVLCPRGGL